MTPRTILLGGLKLLAWSFAVGLVLSFLGIDPVRLLVDFPRALTDLGEWVVSMIRWAVPYVLLGAVVVLPVAAVIALLSFLKRKNR